MSSTLQFPIPLKAFVTLRPWNLDVMSTTKLLREYGEDFFPGVATAPVIFWNTAEPPDGRSADEWTREGYLPIDCGLGLLDHHPHNEFPQQCSFTRALELLQLTDEPVLQRFAKYVLYDDTRVAEARDAAPLRGGEEFSLGQLVKDEAGSGEDFEESYRWFSQWFDKYLEKQMRFYTDGKRAFEQAVKGHLTLSDGTWKYCAGINDSDRFGPYARSRHGSSAHVVVQVRTDGHVCIACHGRLNPRHLMMLIRLEEQYCRSDNERAWCTNVGALIKEGVLDQAPQWYFLPTKIRHVGWSLLLNGTQRHTGAEPTAIQDYRRGKHDRRSQNERLLMRLVQLVRTWLLGPYARSFRRIELNDVNVWHDDSSRQVAEVRNGAADQLSDQTGQDEASLPTPIADPAASVTS